MGYNNEACFSFVICLDGSTPVQPRPLLVLPSAAQVAQTKKDDDWLPQTDRAKDNLAFEVGMLAIIYDHTRKFQSDVAYI